MMASSWYTIHYRTKHGDRAKHHIRVASRRLAQQYAISKQYHVRAIRKRTMLDALQAKWVRSMWFKRYVQPRLTRSELYWFTKELHEFLASGLPLLESLRALRGFNPSKRYQRILHAMIHHIQHGKPLSDVMDDFPRTFPRYYTIAIRSGESIGQLTQSLHANAVTLKWLNENRNKIIQATLCPTPADHQPRFF
tara:strand:- start:2 stop:583 length:582 start_codon:yes stop_codon:yes gene_type:complete